MSTTKALFGPPPLFDGEDPKRYDQLLTRITTALPPADILDEILLRDDADLTTEVFRLRQVNVNVVKVNLHKGLAETLTPLAGRSRAEALAEGWVAQKPEIVEEVNKILKSAGLTMDTVRAQTFCLKLNEIERIERLIALAESRRNAALREIERRRQTSR